MENSLEKILKRSLLVSQYIGCVVNMTNEWRSFEKNHMEIILLKWSMALDWKMKLGIWKTMPLHLGVLVLPNSTRNMNNFIHAIIGFYTIEVFYTDTGSLNIEKKHWEKMDKSGLAGKNLLQAKNDFKDGAIFYGLFLAPKIKHYSTLNKYGVIDEKKTFKGFTNIFDNLDKKEYHKMFDGDKWIAEVPSLWKKVIFMV